jgi:hypothetical protein
LKKYENKTMQLINDGWGETQEEGVGTVIKIVFLFKNILK